VKPLLPLFFVVSLGCTETRGAPSTAAPPPVSGSPSLRLMTYNVNYGIAGDGETIAAIADEDADVVLLQETTEAWEASLAAALGGRYPHRAFRHCCGAGGLGILSKHPFDEREYLAPPEGGWFPAWRLVVHTEPGPLQVLNVHLRPQLSESGSFLGGVFTTPPIRRAEIETYFPALDRGLPTVIAGDFNENGRGRAIRFLEDQGMRSAVPAASGATPTWRWQTSLGEIREQLDHVVIDRRLEAVDVRVVERGRSDHMPVVATIRLR
jgi:endonuclease/exonuclease/phosphatase family metal-dependent hydrolase